MTAQQTKTINHIHDGLAAERDQAAEASREQAQLIEESVIIAVQVKLNEGNIEAARAIWRAYREGK